MLLYSKGNQQQNERQPIKWEKIFINHISDMGLISKINKELIQLHSKNKRAKTSEWTFSKEDIQRANRYKKG